MSVVYGAAIPSAVNLDLHRSFVQLFVEADAGSSDNFKHIMGLYLSHFGTSYHIIVLFLPLYGLAGDIIQVGAYWEPAEVYNEGFRQPLVEVLICDADVSSILLL